MDYSFISFAVADRPGPGHQLYCRILFPPHKKSFQLNADEKTSRKRCITCYPKNDAKCTPDFALRTADVRSIPFDT